MTAICCGMPQQACCKDLAAEHLQQAEWVAGIGMGMYACDRALASTVHVHAHSSLLAICITYTGYLSITITRARTRRPPPFPD